VAGPNQLAEAAGVPVPTVARIESGTRQPSLVTISRLLAAADLELRARLEPYDDHDDVLDARRTALTPEQQAQHATAYEQTSRVLAEARRSATASP
jgi:transcriptional regulator with XRE-family HTH domain